MIVMEGQSITLQGQMERDEDEESYMKFMKKLKEVEDRLQIPSTRAKPLTL